MGGEEGAHSYVWARASINNGHTRDLCDPSRKETTAEDAQKNIQVIKTASKVEILQSSHSLQGKWIVAHVYLRPLNDSLTQCCLEIWSEERNLEKLALSSVKVHLRRDRVRRFYSLNAGLSTDMVGLKGCCLTEEKTLFYVTKTSGDGHFICPP